VPRASFQLRLKLVVLVILTLGAGLITTAGPAHAVDTVVAAAGRAGAGLNGCNSLTGKALHECVAGVLDRLAADIAPTGNTETQGALRTAAAGLRAATTKAQALSAISQCQSVLFGNHGRSAASLCAAGVALPASPRSSACSHAPRDSSSRRGDVATYHVSPNGLTSTRNDQAERS
jgi:hypothetical protein